MFQKISTVLIWSEDYKALADWYQEKLGLQIVDTINHPDDTGIRFQIGNGETTLWIGQHSKVHGKNKDMHRHMFNVMVDSVSESFEKLQAKGVVFLAKPFKAPTFDRYFATFYDLDENLVQLIGEK